MTCPGCTAEGPIDVVVDGIGICANCLRSVVVAETRLAMATDTVALSDAHLALIRKARAAARKNL